MTSIDCASQERAQWYFDMACPWFDPSDPLPWPVWPGRFRPPLGRPYGGFCRAVPGEPYAPQGDLLVMGCNMGYARERCQRVPTKGPDAVRFCLQASGKVKWTLEKAHGPVSVGEVGRGEQGGQGTVMDRQIEAYFRACETAGGRSRQSASSAFCDASSGEKTDGAFRTTRPSSRGSSSG